VPISKPDGTRVADYDYELPEGRIARYPAERRDESRLLVLDPLSGAVRDRAFRDLVELIPPGDLLVVNESRVMPARLLGVKPTGAPAEILLLRPAGAEDWSRPGRSWEALVRPGSKLKPGRTVVISDELSVAIVDGLEGGGRIVRLETDLDPLEALERFGHVPLPPYLGRPDQPLDRKRYQTVYARTPGSVAAPTAGFHFTEGLLSELNARGVGRAVITLHVGPGTFRPVEAEDPADHHMHTEVLEIPEGTAEAIAAVHASGGRVWAVGTTVVRALESATTDDGELRAGSGVTDLFIRPPFRFRVVDALITNFHLPRSTLLMLVAAFGGYEAVMAAYAEAVRGGYRFYSYGDAMLLYGRAPHSGAGGR
jgi:S-adenosylmethionine:tRNA ribosyltransferase-isomerase